MVAGRLAPAVAENYGGIRGVFSKIARKTTFSERTYSSSRASALFLLGGGHEKLHRSPAATHKRETEAKAAGHHVLLLICAVLTVRHAGDVLNEGHARRNRALACGVFLVHEKSPGMRAFPP